MNTVKFLGLAVTAAFVFTSCNNTPKEEAPETYEVLDESLALSTESEDAALLEAEEEKTYLYVTARTGLSLREYNNLQSEKLAIMPYGSRLEVLESEPNATMRVQHIAGGMDKVAFNRKTGYAFNGYLSRFFPPEEDMLPKAYAQELKKEFPKVVYNESVQGTASKPINIESLTLPDATWHEAYFIAQQSFKIPKEFVFPNAKGKAKQMVKGPKKENDTWFDALHINRDKQGFLQLEYKYDSVKTTRTVTLTKAKAGIKIEQKLVYK